MDFNTINNIANQYAESKGYCGSSYAGMFDGDFLFHLDRGLNRGHYGFPAYFTISIEGKVTDLENRIDILRAMRIKRANSSRITP